jgi:hypothetical protein
MQPAPNWLASIFGLVVLFAVLGLVLAIRLWPRNRQRSADERAEMDSAPLAPLQKRAWWGLAIGTLTLVAITTILMRTGAQAYWEDDALRTKVVAIFLGGLFAYVVVLLTLVKSELGGGIDERDREILSRAPVAQSAAMLIALAAWCVSLQELYRGQEGIPRVFLYLIFGSIVLVNIAAHSAGILLGYWFRARHGEG